MEGPVGGPMSETTPLPTSGTDAPARETHRLPALDGVRALAIVLVLLFHGGFGWAQGGFFGVDVFFVLSGFLITGLLVNEFSRRDTIGLVRFWGHRVRRLLPALLAVLLVVCAYGVVVATPDTLDQLRSDAFATLFYGNNWHLVAGDSGYFAALNTPRPLLHTWSLSIEEQFYVIWPLVVLGLLRLRRSRTLLLGVTVVLAVASATEMAWLYHGGSGASRVYYGTDTRAQALLIGAALAVILARPPGRTSPPSPAVSPPGSPGTGGAGRHQDIGPDPDAGGEPRIELIGTKVKNGAFLRFIAVMGALSLAGIIWLAVATSSATPWLYDGGFTLLAVAAAVLIASVTLVPTTPWARLLSLRPIRYLGSISYGLYLWHWPIFVFLDSARTGLVGWPLFLLRVGLSVGVAALSLHFLELPIRRGALRGVRGWVVAPLSVAATGLAIVLATAGATAAVDAEVPPANQSSTSLPPSSDAANTPSVAAGTAGPIRLLLIGDSEASFLGFGLGPDSGRYDIDFAGDGTFGCGFTHNTTLFHGTVVPGTVGYRGGKVAVACPTQLARWGNDLEAFHPDVVVLVEGEYEVRNQLLPGGDEHLNQVHFDQVEQAAIQSAVNVILAHGSAVLLVAAPYYQQPEQANGQPWPEDSPARVNGYNRLIQRVAARSGPLVEVNTSLHHLLDPGGHYAQVVDGRHVRFADGVHVSTSGALLVAPSILEQAHVLGVAARVGRTVSATTITSPG